MRNARLLLALVAIGCAAPPSARHHDGSLPSRDGAASSTAHDIGADWIEHRAVHPHPSAAYAWVDIVLEVTGREVDMVGARPTIISRQMAIPLTAMYDAWAADMAGISRVMGGYHIQADNIEGLKLGRTIAEQTWPIYRSYFDGTAAAPTDACLPTRLASPRR